MFDLRSGAPRRRLLLPLLLLELALPACGSNSAPLAPQASAASAGATSAPQPSSSASASAGASFQWPVPEGWKPETIPFPLEFAPDLPYRGVEEIRFAPAFFEPSAPGYFSYAFIWWLEGRPELDRPRLERDLARYFAGLCDAVGGKKFSFDPKRFKAQLEPSAEPAAMALPGVRALRGTLDAYDPFKNGNGREISLNLDIAIGDCSDGHRVLMVAASPKPRSDAIWKALAEREASFRCP
jgi:hypothetical protein